MCIIDSAGNCTVFERSIIRIFHLMATKGYTNFVSLESQVRSKYPGLSSKVRGLSCQVHAPDSRDFMGSN